LLRTQEEYVKGLRHRLSERALERHLRRNAPQPRAELTESVLRAIGSRRRTRPALRVAVTGGLTAAMLVALGAVGGIGYAASSAAHAVKAVHRVLVPSSKQSAIVVRGLSAGGDQYRPGYGFGDPNHNHSGPPGLQRQGGAFQPLLTSQPVKGTNFERVNFNVVLDEQAHLWISVLSPQGKPLQLNQKRSKVGKAIKGKPTKFIQYLALVPRTLPMSLTIPGNLLKPGKTYRVRIVARDPSGKKKTLIVPFRA
jgi:hypothetical protein